MNTRLRKLCRLAALVALQIVLSRFVSPKVGESFKLGFGFLAVMLAGALEGYLGGIIVAAVSDVLGALLFPQGPFFIGYTFTAALTGFILGAFLCSPKKTVSPARIIAAYLLNAVLVTLVVNTAVIAFQYGWLLSSTKSLNQVISRFFVYLPKRALEAAIMLPVQVSLTWLLLCIIKLDKRIGHYPPVREFPQINIPKQLIDLVLAFPIFVCLTCELYNLPASKGDMRLETYVKAFLFPDALIATLTYVCAYLLLRFRPAAAHKAPRALFALLPAAIFIVGGVYSAERIVLSFDIYGWTLICLSSAGAYILFYTLSAYVLAYAHRLQSDSSEISLAKTWLLIFLCSVPYLLITRGVIHTDTYDQLRQYAATFFDHSIYSRTIVVSSFTRASMLINDTQPVLHTLVLGVIFFTFGTKTGLFLTVLIQVALSSLAAACGIQLICRLGVKRRIGMLLKWIYALFPYYQSYFCSTVKESAFAIAFLFSLIFIVRLFALPQETSKKISTLVFGSISIVICGLLRFFSLYVLLLPLVCLCVYLIRQRILRPVAFIASALSLMLIVTYVVYPLIGIGKGPRSEKLPLMLAQTALYRETYPDELSDEEAAVLNEFLSKGYDPHSLDQIKKAALFKNGNSDGYKWADYFRVWKQLGLRRPELYLNTVLSMGSKYWELKKNPVRWQTLIYAGDFCSYTNGFNENPRNLGEGVLEYKLSANDLNLHYTVKAAVMFLAGFPVISMLFKCGTYLFAMLFAAFYSVVKRKRGISVLICLLLYGIGLGFAPLSGSGRYSFPIVFTVPIVLTAVLLLPGKKKNPAEIPD
ncbi:MAG: folate family ECF transporter S component [Clostridiales bacterium]|nr:folate family ECF transporter S component [Clostridiales bacterium]